MGTTLPVLRGLCSEILDLLKTRLRSSLTPAGLSLRAAAETHFQEWGFEANQPRTWGSAGTPTTLPTQKLRVEEIANGRSPPRPSQFRSQPLGATSRSFCWKIIPTLQASRISGKILRGLQLITMKVGTTRSPDKLFTQEISANVL